MKFKLIACFTGYHFCKIIIKWCFLKTWTIFNLNKIDQVFWKGHETYWNIKVVGEQTDGHITYYD